VLKKLHVRVEGGGRLPRGKVEKKRNSFDEGKKKSVGEGGRRRRCIGRSGKKKESPWRGDKKEKEDGAVHADTGRGDNRRKN